MCIDPGSSGQTMAERISNRMPRKHPVPGGASRTAAKEETRRGIVLSALLHLCLGLVAWLIISATGKPAEPLSTRLYDIEFIPLSALESILPKGSAPQKKSEAVVATTGTTTSLPPRELRPAASPARAAVATTKTWSESLTTAVANPSEPVGIAQGTASSLEQARINYQDMVASLLARAKRYPERALRRRMTGDGTIRIEIASDGSLSEFTIVRSTDSPILDEELKAMVNRASPFPAFPPDLRRQSLALVVPITFRLDG